MDSQEQRIEEMIAIEDSLAREVEGRASEVDESPPEDDVEPYVPDFPTDDLSPRTGRVVSFERTGVFKSVPDFKTGFGYGNARIRVIQFEILRENGETFTETVGWPSDPTDRSEPLVRLCEHVGVPIERIGDLRGARVPLQEGALGGALEIPPIQTRGNRAIFWARRRRSYLSDRLDTDWFYFGWVLAFPAAVVLGVFLEQSPMWDLIGVVFMTVISLWIFSAVISNEFAFFDRCLSRYSDVKETLFPRS